MAAAEFIDTTQNLISDAGIAHGYSSGLSTGVLEAGKAMDIVRSATRVVTEAANATTAAAGAVAGAAVNGIIGGVQGTARGVRDGVSNGSHSTPAALLVMGAIGATGLIEWPVLLTVGGTALLVRQINQRNSAHAEAATTSSVQAAPRRTPAKKAAKKAPPRKTSPRKASARKSTRAKAQR